MLQWARAGESERQLRDVVGIFELRANEFDLAYVDRWVRELGIEELWARVRQESER